MCSRLGVSLRLLGLPEKSEVDHGGEDGGT